MAKGIILQVGTVKRDGESVTLSGWTIDGGNAAVDAGAVGDLNAPYFGGWSLVELEQMAHEDLLQKVAQQQIDLASLNK